MINNQNKLYFKHLSNTKPSIILAKDFLNKKDAIVNFKDDILPLTKGNMSKQTP